MECDSLPFDVFAQKDIHGQALCADIATTVTASCGYEREGIVTKPDDLFSTLLSMAELCGLGHFGRGIQSLAS